MDIVKELGALLLMPLFGIVFWFLRQKDEAQAKQISTLWLKHDQDVERLAALEITLAKEYYDKDEVDTKLEKLK